MCDQYLAQLMSQTALIQMFITQEHDFVCLFVCLFVVQSVELLV